MLAIAATTLAQAASEHLLAAHISFICATGKVSYEAEQVEEEGGREWAPSLTIWLGLELLGVADEPIVVSVGTCPPATRQQSVPCHPLVASQPLATSQASAVGSKSAVGDKAAVRKFATGNVRRSLCRFCLGHA